MRKPFKAGPFRAELDSTGTVWTLYAAASPSIGELRLPLSAMAQFRRLVEKAHDYQRRRRRP